MEIFNKGADRKSFGFKLKQLRKSKGISSEALSELIDKSGGSYIRMLEQGKILPSLDTFADLCNALEISPEYLLTDSLHTNNMDQLDDKLKRLTSRDRELVSVLINTMLDENKE